MNFTARNRIWLTAAGCLWTAFTFPAEAGLKKSSIKTKKKICQSPSKSTGSRSSTCGPKVCGQVEEGMASHYGVNDRWHGRKDALGDTYNRYALTAAHKTLPLPCVVHVKNISNGKCVVLVVTDRGPFVRGRVIDVSAKAAEQLGFLRKGLTRVKVELLPKETQLLAHHYRKSKRSRKKIKNAACLMPLICQETSKHKNTLCPLSCCSPQKMVKTKAVMTAQKSNTPLLPQQLAARPAHSSKAFYVRVTSVTPQQLDALKKRLILDQFAYTVDALSANPSREIYAVRIGPLYNPQYTSTVLAPFLSRIGFTQNAQPVSFGNPF